MRLEVAAAFGHESSRCALGLAPCWPPADAPCLYGRGWSGLPALGKETCLRAALASYEVLWGELCPELEVTEAWVLHPSEETRKVAGRLASVPGRWSMARVLANRAGAKNHWSRAVALSLTGNPYHMAPERFEVLCAHLQAELVPWALGERDAVAERVARR